MINPLNPDFKNTPASPKRPTFEYAPADPSAPPTASIVTPYYNVGEIFHETARCILGQSMQQFEWIIVNDASTDSAAIAVLDEYREMARRDPRIRIIDHKQNHGLSAARNTGYRAARTPYVMQVDGDDLPEPTMLEKCCWFFECNPEAAFCKGYNVGFGAEEYLWTKGFHSTSEFIDHDNRVSVLVAVRKDVHAAVGGYDETNRAGGEDWEFWVRCAAHGYWGDTIPEYLDWYRRRDNQWSRWGNLGTPERKESFRTALAQRFPHLLNGGFPRHHRPWHMPFEAIDETINLRNPLKKTKQRLLMVVPWLRLGGADRCNLDIVRVLKARGWDVTVATTLPGHPWLHEFTALTPDVFMLDHLARPPHYPRMLDYLIQSRQPDVVMISNSQMGYLLLPYLRSRHPDTTFVDFNHMEEPEWQNGGHPRSGCGFQDQIDLSITVSRHLKNWMAAEPRRADPERIEVCYINADTRMFRPDADGRARWRGILGIDAETPVLLYAARLCPQKQPLVFARSIQLLLERMRPAVTTGAELNGHAPAALTASYKPPFVALVAGDGELNHELRAAIELAGIGGVVRMLGSVPTDKMPSLMAASDIFFLPSMWEGIALSFYEAMAAGLCIVGADVGGQAELVTPQTGVLLPFERRDPEAEAQAYAHTLEELIRSPDRMRSYGAAARARIQKHFELECMGDRLLECFARANDLKREQPRQAVTPALAREMAVQGVEMMRIQELAEELWAFRERVRRESSASTTLGAPDHDAERNAEAAAVLAHLETSRSWRAIQAAKATLPYKMLARARFGPDWQHVDPKEPPHLRLERIRASRSYKIIVAMKRAPLFSAFFKKS